MEAGTGWCWELFATNLQSGGPGVYGHSLPTEARVKYSSNLGDRTALFSGSTVLPNGATVQKR